MAINYPTSLDSFTNPTSSNPQNNPSHSAQHSNENDAIVQLETKLGTGASTPTSGKFMVGTGTGVSGWGDVPSGTIIESPILRGFGGWQEANETWTYSSVDGSTALYTISGDVRTKYSPGMRVKYTQDQALSHYWTFNTNSTPDVGSATMADIGTPTYSAGKFGNALTLNGTNQALSITDAAAFKPTVEFTIGGWFKTSNTGAFKIAFSSYSENANQAGVQIGISDTNKAAIVIGNNSGPGINSSAFGNTTVTDGNWHYVVFSFRNNFAEIYVDGKLDGAGFCMTPVYAGTNYVRIGCRSTAGANSLFFNGQIDDLFLINGYALDEKTIKAKYDAGTAQGTGNIAVQKYGIVSAETTYSAPNSTVTIWGGTDYSTANATISSPYFSHEKAPFGFPLNPAKWTVEVTDTTSRSQSSPTQNVWYNLGTTACQITIPIGIWDVYYKVFFNVYAATGVAISQFATLSTANNSESDGDMTSQIEWSGSSQNILVLGANGSINKTLSLSSKTLYYLNSKTKTVSINSISFANDQSKMVIRAVSAYL